MKVTFVRTGERTYVSRARRDDGVTVEIRGAGNPTRLPHDFMHFPAR